MKGFILVLNSVLLLFSLFPDAAAQDNQTVVNGTLTASVNFPATGCTYKWTNNTPGIGLPASGAGNIGSFTAVNTTSSPVTATITVTPVPTGYAYIANSQSNTVSVIDTATNEVVATINSGSGPVGVSASPNGKFVYVTNVGSNTVSVISTASNAVMTTISVGTSPYGISVSPDGSRVYVTNNNRNGTLSVIDAATNIVVATIPIGPDPLGITVSPDGSRVYVANESPTGTVSVINTSTNTVVATIPVGSNPFGIAVSPDGSLVYVTNNQSNTVSVINTSTDAVIATIPVGQGPICIAVGPDGSTAYVGCSGPPGTVGTVYVINTATNTTVAIIGVGDVPPWGISVSPDGGRLYVVNEGAYTVSEINTATNTVISTIAGFNAPVSIGNFISAGPGCNIASFTFTITVNPTFPVITTSDVTGSISACAGTASDSPHILQVAVSGSHLTAGITVTAPAGFEVSLAAGSGYSSNVTLNPSGGSVENAVVYVRSSDSAPPGILSGNIILASAGAASLAVAVAGTIDAQPSPSVTIIASANNICAGTPVNFKAMPANGGPAPSYQWVVNGDNSGTNSATFSSATLNNGDSVYCLMTGDLLCSGPVASAAVYMVVYPLPVVTFNPDTVFTTSNNGVQLSPTITGAIEKYQWSPVDGLSNIDIDDPVASPGGISTYQLQVTTDNGCTATCKVTVIHEWSLGMPNSFTPNGNGHNEVFRIPPGSQFRLEYFQIFDRWGARIFSTQDISTGWDGTYNGLASNAGVFVYLIKGKTLAGEPVFLKGTVILIR
jgi:gliding motility-associated-like protein